MLYRPVSSGGGRPLEIHFVPLKPCRHTGEMSSYILSRGLPLDGVSVTLRHRYRNGPAMLELGSGAVFHLGQHHHVLGDTDIKPPLLGNGLHEDLVLLRQNHCLRLLSCRPNQIVCAPAIYGPNVQKKALGFRLRPMTRAEVRKESLALRDLSLASSLNTTQSVSGLSCVHYDFEAEILERGRDLYEHTSMIRYIYATCHVSQVRREFNERVFAQLFLT